jgi:hypothetical protein
MLHAVNGPEAKPKVKTLDDYLFEVARIIRDEFVGPGFVGRIEINYFEGGGSINVLQSHKFKK